MITNQFPETKGGPMANTPAPSRGRFVWFDLMTTDVAAASKFYGSLLGWKTEEFDMGPAGKYQMIKAGTQGVGGFMQLDKKQPVPSHWIAYMSTDDVDKTTARAKELGAKVHMPPTDIPNVGRFSVVADAQGAVFSPFKSSQPDMPEPEIPAVGTFCWSEAMTTDPAAAAKFYSDLFGYTVEEKDMGPMGTYRLLNRGARQTAGVMKKPDASPVSMWLHYIAVADVDASTRNAKEIGAQVHMPPMDIPGIGRFSVLGDPTGATIALFTGAPPQKK